MIKINEISHTFNNNGNFFKVFDELSYEIEKNEFVTFVGKSGCGKSTLINMIAGYIKPCRGNVFADNTLVENPGRNRIVVNQENDLLNWLTVYENIGLVCKSSKKIDKLLDFISMKKFKNNFPFQLSGGMKKRLSIARALAVDPEILLLDEPFVSLDYFTKETLQVEILKLLKARNKTTILVTHDIEEAIFMSDRVVVLSGQPTDIKDTVVIPFTYPRNLKIKETELFLKLKHKIKAGY